MENIVRIVKNEFNTFFIDLNGEEIGTSCTMNRQRALNNQLNENGYIDAKDFTLKNLKGFKVNEIIRKYFPELNGNFVIDNSRLQGDELKEILIVDIETTDFTPQRGCIIEIGIAGLDLDTGNIRKVFDSMVKESHLLTSEMSEAWIFKNSDITTDMVRDALDSSDIYPALQEILDQFPEGVAAFNSRFDFSFMRDRKISFKELPCLMKAAKPVCNIQGKNGTKNPSAQEAFNYFFPDYKYKETHRAYDDAKHEAMVAYKLYKMGAYAV